MKQPILLSLFLFVSTIMLRAQDVIMPASFERHEGIILKWNYSETIDTTVLRIATIVSTDDKVWLLYDPANSTGLSAIQSRLSAGGANMANFSFIGATAENPWLGDYGPLAGYYVSDTTQNRHFVDAQYYPTLYPEADFLPLLLSSDMEFHYDALPLNFEGGNLLLDGIGRGFVGNKVLAANPTLNSDAIVQMLYTKLGLNDVIILPSVPDCGGGTGSELSRLMKFADPETVLVAQLPSNSPYYQQLELLADTLSKTVNDVGRYFQVVRLPVSPNADGSYAASADGELRTYTSSFFLNNKILLPLYGTTADAQALAIYKQLFAGYQVFQIPSQMLTAAHGSLCRLGVEVPQTTLCRIRHAKLVGMQPYQSETWINTYIQTFLPVDSVQLFFRIHPSPNYNTCIMFGCCGGTSGFFDGYTMTDTLSYYIKAFCGTHIQTLPLAAPTASFTMWFDPFTGIGESEKPQDFTIFPNPAVDFVHIRESHQATVGARYQISAANGAVVAEGRVEDGAAIRLPTHMAQGFYMVKVSTAGKTLVSKLYLQR